MWRAFGAAALVAAVAHPAAATTRVFTAQDDGVGAAGPFTNSMAARGAFLSAAARYGTVVTNGFEETPAGFYSPVVLDGVSISFDAINAGPGISGVTSGVDFGPFYGFNTSPGGSQWLGFPDLFQSAAEFVFGAPTHSFGLFTTGVQSLFTAALTVQFLDGSVAAFDLPLTVNGGASYFGVVDTVGFSRVVVSQANRPGYMDAWGVDDISFNLGGGVPEPAAWALMVGGFGAIGIMARRRRVAAICC
jgi:hypothetical protein